MVPFHRKGQRGVRVFGRFGFIHVDLAHIAVRPLYRWLCLGIFPPASRKSAPGAAEARALRTGFSAAASRTRSSRRCSFCPSGRSAAVVMSKIQRQLSFTRPSGTKTWKKRWARPSLFTRLPEDSAKVAAGKTSPALELVSFKRWSIAITFLAAPIRSVAAPEGTRRKRSFSRIMRVSAVSLF